jgi:hypothetical protein
MLLLVSSGLVAKDYALIVSISKYKHLKKILNVENDISRYKNILKKLNVKKKNIKTLKDKKATKKNILAYIEKVNSSIKQNDRIFIFFTGHGTNTEDEDFGGILQSPEIEKYLTDSGALLPYDFNPKKLSDTIIIGKRDLRESFESIDKVTKKVLIVFDVCYAKGTVKGEDEEDDLKLYHIDTKDDEYPYDNIVYIAASKAQAKPGKLSKILDNCISKDTDLHKLKVCLNKASKKSPHKPVVLSKSKCPKVFNEK